MYEGAMKASVLQTSNLVNCLLDSLPRFVHAA